MAKNGLMKILLWMMWLPLQLHGVVVTEENLAELGSRQLVVPWNGKVVTVAELYGTPLTVETFHPGQRFLDLIANSNEIPTAFDISRFSNERPRFLKLYPFDEIATAYGASESSTVVLVLGKPRTGKTVFLRTMEGGYNGVTPSDLTVYVKLSDAVNLENVNSLTLDDILRASIHEDFVDLFKNVAEVNPAKVRLLLDGVDQVPHAQEKILSIVSELHAKKIKVIMTSCTDLRRKPEIREIQPPVIKIPDSLTSAKMEQYTFDYWIRKYARMNVLLQENSVRQYAKAFQIIIEETPLPRTVEIVTKMADYLSIDVIQNDFLTVKRYAGLDSGISQSPRYIMYLSDGLRFPKMSFYRSYFENLAPMKAVYGPQALEMMFKSQSVAITQELRAGLVMSKHFLAAHGQDAFKFLIFYDGHPVDFVHEEYKRYFAAEYILDSFSTANPLVETFKAVLKDPTNKFVMEFIDSAMDNFAHFDKMKMILSLKRKYTFAVLDNLIEHRFDQSCSKIFEMIGPKVVKKYLNSPRLLQCKNKYSFGMLSETHGLESITYVPRKTMWTEVSGTKPQMIIYLELTASETFAKSLGWKVNPHIEWTYFAEIDSPHFDEFLDRNPRMTYVIDDINKAMYESIRVLGELSMPNLSRLKNLGGDPKDFSINGRTLAHVAAEWLSRPLLQYVHEELGVPLIDRPDNFGRTIFATICDAGWITTQTMNGAWETMDYLIEKGEVLAANSKFFSNDLLQFQLKDEDLPPAFRVLITEEPTAQMSVNEAQYVVNNMVSLSEMDLPLEKLASHRYLVGRHCVRNMNDKDIYNDGVWKVRRIEDSVTISEFIAHLRSDVPLPISATTAYNNIIKNVLLKEAHSFNQFQRRRVFTALAKNTANLAELKALRKLFNQEIAKTLGNIFYEAEVKQIFNKRKHGKFPVIRSPSTIDQRLSITNYDSVPVLDVRAGNSNRGLSPELASQREFNDLFVCEI